MRTWAILLLLIGNLFSPRLGMAVQTPVEFNDVKATFEFGKTVIFYATITSQAGITEAYLFVQPKGQSTRVKPVTINNTGQISLPFDVTTDPLIPFARIEYWFSVTTPDGQKFESSKYVFDYIDNRYQWQILQDDKFQVHWYSGDLTFGQAALNAAGAGLKSAQNYLNLQPNFPLQIYIYSNQVDLQGGLPPGFQSWIAGHASPDIGTILISIAPGPEQQIEFERQIPHEIVHVLQFKLMGETYQRIPTWLVEGSASLAELYPNPDYKWVLDQSVKEERLIPFTSLCTGFPREASGAFLAYAESTSFVRYLYQKYGVSGMVTMMTKYHDGLGCEEGATAAFGSSLSQLENTWQQDALGMISGGLALRNLLPYLVISAILLVVPLVIGLLLLRKP
jgi:hypothetical protein